MRRTNKDHLETSELIPESFPFISFFLKESQILRPYWHYQVSDISGLALQSILLHAIIEREFPLMIGACSWQIVNYFTQGIASHDLPPLKYGISHTLLKFINTMNKGETAPYREIEKYGRQKRTTQKA